MLIKLKEFKEKEKSYVGIQEKDQVTHKGKKTRISSDFDSNTLWEKTID